MRRKDKVLIISSEFPPGPGGIGKHAFDLARSLADFGYKVAVYTSQDFSSEVEIENFNSENKNSFDIYHFKRSGISTYIQRWRNVKLYLLKHQPDKVIVTGRFSLWLGYFIKLKFKNKLKVHAFVHGSELSKRNKLYHLLTIRSLLKVDQVWAVSTFTRNLLAGLIKRNDIKVLPNGLWFGDWNQEETTSETIRLSGNPSLLTVGQLSPRKGQHRVIKALPKLKSVYPNVHFHMAGIPTISEMLKKIAVENHVENFITIHGKISSTSLLGKYYKACQIFIMLSENQSDGDSEGFGIAILEANYFGKPAIGARGCGIEDAITDGYNGRLVDGNNTTEILDAISDITKHYDEYSARAKKWAAKHNWKELIIRFENLQDLDKKELDYFVS